MTDTTTVQLAMLPFDVRDEILDALGNADWKATLRLAATAKWIGSQTTERASLWRSVLARERLPGSSFADFNNHMTRFQGYRHQLVAGILECHRKAISDEKWYFIDAEDNQEMPLSDAIKAWGEKRLDKECYCWQEGMAEWVPIEQCPKFHDLLLQASVGGGDMASGEGGEGEGGCSPPGPRAAR